MWGGSRGGGEGRSPRSPPSSAEQSGAGGRRDFTARRRPASARPRPAPPQPPGKRRGGDTRGPEAHRRRGGGGRGQRRRRSFRCGSRGAGPGRAGQGRALGLEADGGSRPPRPPGAAPPPPLPPPPGGAAPRGERRALPLRCRRPAPYLCRARRRRRRRRSSPGPAAAAAAPAGAGTESAAPPSRGPEERQRDRERGRARRTMWVPLLACLTAGIVSVPKCQRGPGALLGAARLLAAVPGLCQRPENRCATSNAGTCTKCLALGPECGWCAQEDFMADGTQKGRCDTVSNLMKRGCQSDLVENPTVRVTIPSDQETNTQVTPGKVSVQLRPGSEANFILKVRPLEKYPVDLYYLVDVSASMHNNIEKLNSVGFALSKKMANISLDFRLGFGSYVDKTVSPYISIHPGRIHNQCSDYNLDCMPPHGYIHVLSLTDNIAEFRNAVNKQKISGNIDTPEGGFDAMLQAAVCQSHIGWRKEAKRLLLVMTDQTSHLALDSKLAGIVIPHDGNCHLKDNVYVKATSMEHPSLGQLSEKLIDNNINVIFAVQGSQFHWYKDLLPLLPGTVARQIESQAANLNDLVVEAYQKLISEVKIQVDNQIQDLNFNITAICPDGSKKTGMEGCKNVGYNEEVLFNVSVTMKGCDTTGGRKYAILKPIGFNETTIINVQKSCACQSGDSARQKRVWADETFPDGRQPDCSDNDCSSHGDTVHSERCRQHPNQPICSGQGNCIDGKCFCYKNKLGKVYGKYCEMDDFSCPYHQGNLCSGNGECEAGKCKCFAGWEGDRCQCSLQSAKQCLNSKGQICSGRGNCVCGKCECTDPRSFGRFCEYCPACNKACEENWNCVQCHHSNNASQAKLDQCKTSCAYLLHYIDQTSECFSGRSYFRVFSIIFIVTFLIGLLVVLIIRQIILQGNSNKVKSSADYRVSATKKDKMFLPTVCTRTVTYRRDKPEEINIDISKLRLNETFKCEF